MIRPLIATLVLSFLAIAAEGADAITWAAVGDSTVADYAPQSKLQGWGWGLRSYVADRVTVVNTAANGRSSQSFRTEGRWEPTLAENPSLVFIQFGHNDNLGKGPGRETDPSVGGDFRANMRRYVEEARAAGATPVLVTPPQRRKYDADNQIIADGPNAPYAEAIRAVAEETGTILIDLNEHTRKLFNELGPAGSDPLQTEGDRTHFSPEGARRLAALVLEDLCAQRPELASCLDPSAPLQP